MKKIVAVMAVLMVSVFMLNPSLFCQEKPAAVSNRIIEEKRAELNNTQWVIEILPLGEKGKPEGDVLSFSENKVSSKNLAAAGFEPTEFRLSVKDDGTVVWEAMQRSEKGDVMLWRGDILGGVMSGVLNRRDENGKVIDFSFVGKR